MPNDVIIDHLKQGQSSCHKWGAANQVEFEATKEQFTIIHKDDPFGPGFKLLGIFFDPKFSMQLTLTTLKNKLNAKLRCLFRIRRFYSFKQYLSIYKTQIWSSVEWATAGIFHCTPIQLHVIDGVQHRFLRFVGMSQSEAFLSHNLAPLSLRRSIAMLGFIYRCVRNLAPEPCCSLFSIDHRRNSALRSNSRLHQHQLVDPVDRSTTPLLSRSVLGLVLFWNNLPKDAVYAPTVKDFQRYITEKMRCSKVVQLTTSVHLSSSMFVTEPRRIPNF